jgi:hypothetical protein
MPIQTNDRETKFFFHSTMRQTTSADPGNCTISLGDSIPQVKEIELLSFHMPNRFFNIIAGVNDSFTYVRTTGGDLAHEDPMDVETPLVPLSTTVTIPAGRYAAITDLITVITTLVNAADAGADMTGVYSTRNFSCLFGDSAEAGYINFSSATSPFRLFGYLQTTYTFTAGSTTTAPFMSRLDTMSCLMICFTNLEASNSSQWSDVYPLKPGVETGKAHFLMTFEATDATIQHVNNSYTPQQMICFSSPVNISKFDVQLWDPETRRIVSTYGAEWQMGLRIRYHEYSQQVSIS